MLPIGIDSKILFEIKETKFTKIISDNENYKNN